MCTDDFIFPVFQFKLVEPGNGHDLVYGPDAKILLDSIRITIPSDRTYTLPLRQEIDTPHASAVLVSAAPGDVILEIGRPGKVTNDKLNFQIRPSGCCSREIYGVLLNENPVPLERDSAGTFLIPYTL
jgi:hypothetical protein